MGNVYKDMVGEKVRLNIQKINGLRVLKSQKIDLEYIACEEYKENNTPPALSKEWQPVTDKTLFEGVDTHYWLHTKFKTPEALNDYTEMRVALRTGREGWDDALNPQFTVFINSETYQALDTNHHWFSLECAKEYDIYLYLYTGMVSSKKFFTVEANLQTIDKKTEKLYYDLNVPYMCLETLDTESYDFIKIRDCLSKACMNLDFRDVHSDEYYKGVDDTLEYLEKEFYGKICGNTEGNISCLGHTHIDVAWLWTVAQTREKAQRSFSTVINLMDKYDDYVFLSSQPQLYQFVKEDDPELYAKIKKRVKEGRWEVEGAMWLEADTNLSDGESLIRQIIHGKRFMKNEFGVESEILWLPDVFGYSGALPQILQKCGVKKFFTAKLHLNDVNPMPDDTFIWEGIDGSSVFASLVTSYVVNLTPKSVLSAWKNYKNKEHSSHQLQLMGYGDGGGGTTAEMIEICRRLEHGIPGIPKTSIEKAGDFFNRIKEDFDKNSKELKCTPKWVGELYFERHRGTYTSMARIKKYNRKSEYSQLEAEKWALADKILCGKDYPENELKENQMLILLNQFHDILPGSSIKQVYEVCDKEYEKVLSSNGDIKVNAISSIASDLNTEGGILVYNGTSFEVSDYVTLGGKTYYAENIPANGYKVIEKKEAENIIKVSKKTIENDVIKVTFNDKYHIISIYDKEEKREVLSNGAEANVFEVFEDYPRVYDAWEINSYYKHKMWIADDVSEVTLENDGIIVKRKYMKSDIVQKIKLTCGSKRIDFVTNIDWHEDHVLLKAAFPVDIRSTYATYDIQFGNIARPTVENTSWDKEKFEVSAHKWADLSENGYGVSLLNDCKYGYSILGNVMTISLLKAATYPNPVADREFHEFTYSLYPHKGDFTDGGTIKESYLLNKPLSALEVSKNDGALPDVWYMVKTDKENAVVEAVKKAENENAVVVRVFESFNRKSHVAVDVGFEFKEVYLCDMLENNIEKLSHSDKTVEIDIKNFEIVTIKFVR